MVTALLAATILLTGCAAAAATPAEQAALFWEAVASGDRDAALAVIDPEALASGKANTFGRGATLEDQFEWYEAVGWEWTFGGCSEGEAFVECTATANNPWSDVLGVDPVTGTFEVEVGEAGITAITDQADSFISQWSPQVFEVFGNWVLDHHLDEGELMFDFSVDVSPEILDLYRVNTERFVEAHAP